MDNRAIGIIDSGLGGLTAYRELRRLTESYNEATDPKQQAAPKKELIWFEHSGHNPMTDEPERFKSLLRDRLLTLEKEDPTT